MYDVAVVGSGPGGATVARELARAGASVIVLERGSDRPPSGTVRQAVRELWWPGRSMSVVGPRRRPVAVLRGITLGGSSMYFFATAWEPPYQWFDRFGVDLRADADALRAELAPAPLPDDLTGPRARILATAARSLGHDWRPVPKFVDVEVLRARGPSGYGAARWTARRFLDDAAAAGAVIRAGARVTELTVRHNRVEGVELAGVQGTELVRAGQVVLAAGALGSAPLLRAAGIERAGHNWFYDPVVAINGVRDDLDAGFEPPMCGAVNNEPDGWMLTDLCRPRWLHEALTLSAGRPDRLGQYRRTLSVMVKVRDELSGVVSEHGVARKPLARVDRERLRSGEAAARELLRAAGAKSIHASQRVAVHPGGTARIGDVVDADLATTVDGLYVCDSSVLPIAWGVPPTFTIMSLARRLGRHLKV
ncbi:MAG TPA: FAD-dependent oxidoreductase [Sporichthyaceae bacterium]|nr:FAD-dependent oxidoreductase [Sporichthyaceae bacterium]